MSCLVSDCRPLQGAWHARLFFVPKVLLIQNKRNHVPAAVFAGFFVATKPLQPPPYLGSCQCPADLGHSLCCDIIEAAVISGICQGQQQVPPAHPTQQHSKNTQWDVVTQSTMVVTQCHASRGYQNTCHIARQLTQQQPTRLQLLEKDPNTRAGEQHTDVPDGRVSINKHNAP